MPKLTKRFLDGLRPQAEKDVVVWDSELRGFGVRMKSTGSASYILQYRNEEGRSRRVTLGALGVLTPEEARRIAKVKLGEVARGGDPAEAKREARTAPTVAEICDWYLEKAESGELRGRRGRPIAKTTLALDRSRINTHVRPLIGNRLARALSVADIERFQAEVTAGKTAKPRKGRGGVTTGGNGIAGRTVGMLHTIFQQAMRWKIIGENPAKGVRKATPEIKNKRRLSLEEIGVLGQTMRDAVDESPVALDAIRFAILSGFRRMETLGLERNWVDASPASVRFPTTKSGAQVRAIGAAALKVLERQPVIADNPYVFPGELGDGHFVGLPRVLKRLCKTAELEGVTPHVLRHTFASVAGDMGYSELTIAGLLGHAGRGVTQRYVHLDKALGVAAEQIAAEIEQALGATVSLRSLQTAA